MRHTDVKSSMKHVGTSSSKMTSLRNCTITMASAQTSEVDTELEPFTYMRV